MQSISISALYLMQLKWKIPQSSFSSEVISSGMCEYFMQDLLIR